MVRTYFHSSITHLENYTKKGYYKVMQLVVTSNIYNFLATHFNLTNMLSKPNLSKLNLTKPNLTKPNLTKPNLTKPNL